MGNDSAVPIVAEKKRTIQSTNNNNLLESGAAGAGGGGCGTADIGGVSDMGEAGAPSDGAPVHPVLAKQQNK